MNVQKQSRVNTILELLNNCPRTLTTKTTIPPLNKSDVDTLLSTQIVEEIPDSEPVILGSAFSVVETKNNRLRRRFILWPETVNKWIESQGYKADIDLHVDTDAVLD